MIFGIGTDIIEVRRVKRELRRRSRLKEKIFTPREIGYCESRGRGAHQFAVRFAAKEAFFKALGTGWGGGYRFVEIEILNDRWEKPQAFVHGKVNTFCQENGITGFNISLSHDKDVAEAVVVLETD